MTRFLGKFFVFFLFFFHTLTAWSETRVTILHVDVGDGHKSAAAAVEQALQDHRPDVRVQNLELIGLMSKNGEAVTRDLYNWSLKKFPALWHFCFFTLFNWLGYSNLERYTAELTTPRLAKAVQENQPDIVICTHPSATMIASGLIKRGILSRKTKLITVNTDYVITESFNVPGMLIMPHRDLAKDAVTMGRSPQSVTYTDGIITQRRFRVRFDENFRMRLRKDLGLDSRPDGERRPMFMFAGGSAGLYLEQVAEFLLNWKPSQPIDVVIVTGNNDDVKRRLATIRDSGLMSKKIETVLLPGYAGRNGTPSMQEFMEVADVLISKAGGLTTTERLSRGKSGLAQLVLTDEQGRLHPGQETGNVAFLGGRDMLESLESLEDLENVEEILKRARIQQEQIPKHFSGIFSVDRQFINIFNAVEVREKKYPRYRRFKWARLKNIPSVCKPALSFLFR